MGMLEAWSRQSCLGPAQITFFMFLVLFKDGGSRGRQEVGEFKNSLSCF